MNSNFPKGCLIFPSIVFLAAMAGFMSDSMNVLQILNIDRSHKTELVKFEAQHNIASIQYPSFMNGRIDNDISFLIGLNKYELQDIEQRFFLKQFGIGDPFSVVGGIYMPVNSKLIYDFQKKFNKTEPKLSYEEFQRRYEDGFAFLSDSLEYKLNEIIDEMESSEHVAVMVKSVQRENDVCKINLEIDLSEDVPLYRYMQGAICILQITFDKEYMTCVFSVSQKTFIGDHRRTFQKVIKSFQVDKDKVTKIPKDKIKQSFDDIASTIKRFVKHLEKN